MELAVEARHVIGHVCILEQLDLSGQNLLRLLIVALLLRLLALELDQRE